MVKDLKDTSTGIGTKVPVVAGNTNAVTTTPPRSEPVLVETVPRRSHGIDYLVVETGVMRRLEDALAEHGAVGWELCGIEPLEPVGLRSRLVFKRSAQFRGRGVREKATVAEGV